MCFVRNNEEIHFYFKNREKLRAEALSELPKKKNKWSIKTGKDKKGTFFILQEYFISASNSDVYRK